MPIRQDDPIRQPVRYKMQNYRNLRQGLYGNRLRSWPWREWRSGLCQGNVVIQYLGAGGGGGPAIYDIRQEDLAGVVDAISGPPRWELDRITINEQAPAHLVVIQGEHLNEPGGWVRYSTCRMQMRPALAAGSAEMPEYIGVRQLMAPMTPSSREDYLALLEQYPNHVLEASVYERCIGNIPGRNAIVWEVRQY